MPSKPRTEAGRALLADYATPSAKWKALAETQHRARFAARILAIEAQAAADRDAEVARLRAFVTRWDEYFEVAGTDDEASEAEMWEAIVKARAALDAGGEQR